MDEPVMLSDQDSCPHPVESYKTYYKTAKDGRKIPFDINTERHAGRFPFTRSIFHVLRVVSGWAS